MKRTMVYKVNKLAKTIISRDKAFVNHTISKVLTTSLIKSASIGVGTAMCLGGLMLTPTVVSVNLENSGTLSQMSSDEIKDVLLVNEELSQREKNKLVAIAEESSGLDDLSTIKTISPLAIIDQSVMVKDDTPSSEDSTGTVITDTTIVPAINTTPNVLSGENTVDGSYQGIVFHVEYQRNILEDGSITFTAHISKPFDVKDYGFDIDIKGEGNLNNTVNYYITSGNLTTLDTNGDSKTFTIEGENGTYTNLNGMPSSSIVITAKDNSTPINLNSVIGEAVALSLK